MRPREWDGLALLCSSDEIEAMMEEEEQDKRSHGVHVESAAASGTALGMLVKDLQDLEVGGRQFPILSRFASCTTRRTPEAGCPSTQ